MTSLLHLDSSAHRSEESVSRQLTALFAHTWRTAHGPAGYRYRDLAADPVPPLDTAYSLGRAGTSRRPTCGRTSVRRGWRRRTCASSTPR